MSYYYTSLGLGYSSKNDDSPYVMYNELQHYDKQLEKLIPGKIKDLIYLDGGANGDVYKIQNTSLVLKFTNDIKEATFCQFLKTKRSTRPYLPKIKFVYKIKAKLFVICMEELKPLTGQQNNIITDSIHYSPSPFTAKYHEYIRKLARKKNSSLTLINYCMAADKFFSFLKSIGLRNYDHHEGNLMIRPKTKEFVFIDYGHIGLPKKFPKTPVPQLP